MEIFEIRKFPYGNIRIKKTMISDFFFRFSIFCVFELVKRQNYFSRLVRIVLSNVRIISVVACIVLVYFCDFVFFCEFAFLF